MAHKTNITLGVLGPYCVLPNLELSGSLVSNYTIKREISLDQFDANIGVYYNDFAVQIADSTPLPNVHVNIKLFTDCGVYLSTAEEDYSGNTGGCAAVVASQDIIANEDVIGVIGLEYSTAAK
ncbi:UNVERIFIED_CONTAM: hypothetical protein HDU68_010147 [Siphonaria sp. JEL0065]|nr:hypothetical protein HDU68_010147 [Siphonaria sp. JEL0065]